LGVGRGGVSILWFLNLIFDWLLMTLCLTSLYGHNVSNWLLLASSWPSLLKRYFSETCRKMTVFPSQRLSTVPPVQCANFSFTHLIKTFQLCALKLKTNCCSLVTMISTERRHQYALSLFLSSICCLCLCHTQLFPSHLFTCTRTDVHAKTIHSLML